MFNQQFQHFYVIRKSSDTHWRVGIVSVIANSSVYISTLADEKFSDLICIQLDSKFQRCLDLSPIKLPVPNVLSPSALCLHCSPGGSLQIHRHLHKEPSEEYFFISIADEEVYQFLVVYMRSHVKNSIFEIFFAASVSGVTKIKKHFMNKSSRKISRKNFIENIFHLIEQFSSLTSFFQAILNHSCVQRKLGRHFVVKLIFISILDPQRQFVIRSVQYIKQGKSSHYSVNVKASRHQLNNMLLHNLTAHFFLSIAINRQFAMIAYNIDITTCIQKILKTRLRFISVSVYEPIPWKMKTRLLVI
ncbi:Protein of unknown function, partial [Cotesia congregata]